MTSATGSGPVASPAVAARPAEASSAAVTGAATRSAPSTSNGHTTEPARPAPALPLEARQPLPGPGDGEELEDDDELDDDELDDDEDGDDELAEGEDDELVDEDDDDLDDEDDDDLDDEDDDDDDLDDDEEDDDYEVIDKTAAELAEEGIEGPGEITVLARKRVPKQPKQRPERTADTPSASAAEARRRRRRRRRKRRAMLPPKSAFTTPVLSTAAPLPESPSRRMGGGAGPVIEYVRGPMRIAMAPVASANPNDAGAGRPRRGKKLRRWERGPGFRSEGPRGERAGRPGMSARPDGRPQPWQGPSDANGGPGERRRRRRRRRRRPGDSLPMQGQPGFAPGGNGGPGNEAPVSFFAPAGGTGAPVVLGPDGQPLRKRRRRRRRGRGGRQREWRTQGQGGDGGGGTGGPPPSADGNGSISDGGDAG